MTQYVLNKGIALLLIKAFVHVCAKYISNQLRLVCPLLQWKTNECFGSTDFGLLSI